jgi:FlaA1/EpsC-like NDP-sugar epimerase
MNRPIARMLANLLSPRSALVLLFDLAAVVAAWLLAFALRFNLDVPQEYAIAALRSLGWVLPIYGAVFLLSGLYRGSWRFASLPDLLRIAKAVLLSATAVAFVAYLLQLALPLPRSVLLLAPLLTLLAMGGARAPYRSWREQQGRSGVESRGKPVLVLGAGRSGATLVRELQNSAEWRVVGLLDDDATLRGREVLGKPVLGSFDDLAAVAARFQVHHAIIALPQSTAAERQRAANLCLRAGVKGMTVPPLADVIDGRVTLSHVRQINVEDLLGREPVWIDTKNVGELLQGRCVLVTGAGGSIGSELCRQIARFAPTRIVFVEQSEYALYRLQEEFCEAFPEIDTLPLIGDVKDRERVDQILRDVRPTVVFHAAAYKHVPLMEQGNAWQAVLNNVIGTHVVASAAIRHGVRKFVLVSTDKAVNPTSVMGATKRFAEMVCQALQSTSTATAMIVVRFGNVLGSAGSVIPKFQEQVARGGPVTVTHKDITRYFMSIPEAAQLVLQAASMGGTGQIFVLEMGEPIRIADLARDIIRLSGFNDEQVKIEYTGLRPGEKLFEEVMDRRERLLDTPHPNLRVALARGVALELAMAAVTQLNATPAESDEGTRAVMRRWVPEYRDAVPVDTNTHFSPPANQPDCRTTVRA